MLDEELQDAMARICFIAGNRNLNWSLQRTWPTNAAHSLSMPQQPSYPGWSQSEHGGCSQSPPKTSAQMTLAALLEPMPTILFMSQDLPHWPFSIWTLWCHSVTTCWQPIRWTLWCHQDEDAWKSTTERILSVPWAPLYSLLVITSHPRSFSPPLSFVSHHFSCYTALSLLASKCFFSCELSCL